MRTTKLKLFFIALAGLTLLAGHLSGGSSEAAAAVDDILNPHYKGASAFNFVGAAPNVPRCGAFPENVQLSFEGAGSIRKVATTRQSFQHAPTRPPTKSLT